jgi:hypothetical protein
MGDGTVQSAQERAMDWTAKELGFESWQGQKISLFSRASRPAVRPALPPVQWVSSAILASKVARVMYLITHLHPMLKI